MTRARRGDIAQVLREQLARAVAAGSLRPGDRLPSTRDLSQELGADPRVIAAAYRALSVEGIVELRPRSGVFYAAGTSGAVPEPSAQWLVNALVSAVGMGVAVPSVSGWIRRATSSHTLRAAVIATTMDQALGLCRELLDDYGIESRMVDPADLEGEWDARDKLPTPLRRCGLLVTTKAESARAAMLAKRFGMRHVSVSVRPDFLGFELQQLLLRPAFMVVADARFVKIVGLTLRNAPGGEKLRFLVVGRDDLGIIPRDAPTYITQAARKKLGRTRLPGFVLPPARLLPEECAREIITALVESNREAGAG